MGRIGASLSGMELLLLNRMSEANAAAVQNALRRSTGRKINFPSDDPSGFVQVSAFRNRLSNVQQVTKNVTAASSMVSQAQLTLDQVRTQLNSIRTTLLTDADPASPLTSDARTTAQADIDTALDAINALARTDIDGKRILEGSADFVTRGRDASQIDQLQVLSVGGGTVLTAGEQAEVQYTGSNGLVTAGATFTINGDLGSQEITVTTANSLAEVARTVNLASASTGVVAEAVGDTLSLRSANSGLGAGVEVSVSAGTFIVASGNKTSDQGTDPTVNPTAAISGSVQQAATKATLTHEVGGANITDDYNFTITGKRGQTTIDVLAVDNLTLAEFAAVINAESYNTGIVATVNGTDIDFTSVDYGTSAEVTITDNGVTATTFDVIDEEGLAATTDTGTNAVAVINGRTRSGNTAATSAQLVHHSNGGNIDNDATFEIVTATGVTTITVDTGGGTNNTTTKLKATIDGIAGLTATISGDDVTISTDATGAAAILEVRITSGTFAADGGNGDGTAQGTDEVTGVTSVDGNKFSIVENGLHVVVEFGPTFTGTFDTVRIDDQGPLSFALTTDPSRLSTLAIGSVQTAVLGGISGILEDLRTGGSAAGLSTNTSQAIRIVDEALSQLSRIEGRVDGFANASISSAAAISAALETNLSDSIDSIDQVNDTEEALLLAKNQDLATNALSSLAFLDQQRSRIVDLISRLAGF